MYKIIKVSETTIFVGDSNGGQIHSVSKTDLDFNPKVGQEVELYMSESEVIVLPKQEEIKEKTSDDASLNKEGGITINLQNTNNASSPVSASTLDPSLKLVNKVAYILLALFLGSFGIHKFYAGKTGMGFLFVFFFWTFIPTIISLVEAIIAMFKKSDRFGRIYV